MSEKITAVIEIEWTERERGWGQRPDGFSYHPNMEEATKYIADYWKKQPKEVPECYSAPGTARLVEVDPVFALLVEGKGIVWTDKSCKKKK